MKELFVRHKKTLIITTLLCLLPILFGVAMWDRLPDPMPTHFGANGEPNGWSSKPFAVFGLPLFMAAMEWVCLFASSADPRRKNLSPKVMTLVLYIVPVIGLVACGATYAIALGMNFSISMIMSILFGVMFIVIGNYLPKCRQTYTLGIKLPWTLASEENWNKTHRMAGPLWMIGGAVQIVLAFLPGAYAFYGTMVLVFAVVLIPTVYSFLLAKKQGQI